MQNKTTITICLGSSCYRRGNQSILEIIKKYLADNDIGNQVEFKGRLCADKCTEGPILSIDDTMYPGLDNQSVIKVMNKHFFDNE